MEVFKESSIVLRDKGMKMQIPKFIRDELQTGILELLKGEGMIITKPTFKYGSRVIEMRYLKISKAGDKFVRRISFKFKRNRSLDPFPKRNQRYYDEVFNIKVILDNTKRLSITSSSYPNKKPNFKLSKFVKNGLNKIILDYVRTINWMDKDYIINSPTFKYSKNRITFRYFDGKFIEKKIKFRFIKSNSKVWNSTPEIERVVSLIVGQYDLLRNELSYTKKA